MMTFVYYGITDRVESVTGTTGRKHLVLQSVWHSFLKVNVVENWSIFMQKLVARGLLPYPASDCM